MDELICPQAWKWTEIHRNLEAAHRSRNDESIPPPPEMIAPLGASISSLKHRWEDTVYWADQYGFKECIPVLTEDEEFILHH